MLLRNNRFIIKAINFIFFVIFFIPLMICRSRQRDASSAKKILIIEPWGIGDLVMMTVCLSPLRKRFPEAKIVLLAKKYAIDLFEDSRAFDQIIVADLPWTWFSGKFRLWKWDWRSLYLLVQKLKEQPFDLVLDARGDLRSNLLSFITGAPRRLGFNWMGGGFFLTDDLTQDFSLRHRVDAWLKMCLYLGCNIEGALPQLKVSNQSALKVQEFLDANEMHDNDILVGIHPGAAVATRCWPLVRFIHVAEEVLKNKRVHVLVFVSPDGYGEDFGCLSKMTKVRTDLKALTAFIQRCDVLVCNDSGPMHIGTAVNTKVVTIFGPGEKDAIGPYGQDEGVVQIDEVPCRPCFDHCRFNRFCLLNIDEKSVAEKVEEYINKERRDRFSD